MKIQNRIVSCVSIVAFILTSYNSVHAGVGATTPFTTYEAEAGTLAGGATVVSLTAPPTTEFSSPQLEASGHAYVALTGTGQSITWTNKTSGNFTGIDVRFCIPDAANGGGTTATLDLCVNGVLRQAITLNSAQEWLYETSSTYNGQSKTPGTPANGIYPHKFWDDIHVPITGAAVTPGDTVTLQQDAPNTAAFYWIDCVDLELIPAALPEPTTKVLSITDYGAVASPTTDSTAAIQKCINAAETAGDIVWIPAGTFYLNTNAGLTATGVTIEGAGPWYSTIYHNVPLPVPTGTSPSNLIVPTSCTIQNLCMDSDADTQQSTGGNAGAINIKGSNWLINNVWVQHMGAGIWGDGNNGTVENCRLLDTWADGINLNNGNGATGNNEGNNLTAINNYVRGSGDDGLAINSGTGTGTVIMNNTTFINNTSIAAWWANELGIYGGVGNVVENNLLTDTVRDRGMLVGVFGTGSPLDSGVVQGNVLLRCGSYGYGEVHDAMPIGTGSVSGPNTVNNVYVASNIISNPMFDGIHIYENAGNISVGNNVITAPGTTGVVIDSDAVGYGTVTDNTVTNLVAGQKAFVNNSSAFNLNTTNEVVNSAIEASSFNSETGGISTQTCSEGGLNIDDISNGSYTVYNNVNLNGVTNFVARVASYLPAVETNVGNIAIHIDSATGTVIGTCSFNGTGSWQNWATVSCPISGATGYHNIYLVYTGPLNVEWFAFQGTGGGTIAAASFNSETGGISTQTCSEGGQNIDDISTGSYTVYNNLDLNGTTAFTARVASYLPVGTNAGSIAIHLGSPTGTVIATCPVTGTGGWQNWTTVTCNVSGATGFVSVYLVYSGSLNVEWFSFQGNGGTTEAASYNSASGTESLQTCSEGGQDVGNCDPGTYLVYNAVNLNGATTFSAGIAAGGASARTSTGGSIGIFLDSPTGTQIGTLPITGTGGWQTWTTQTCSLSGASGFHNIYLVFSGGPAGGSCNLDWFDFQANSNALEASSYNSESGTISVGTCTEGGSYLADIASGDYLAYSNINLTGMSQLSVRTACAISTGGGTITVHLDSPTGTVIGTITAPYTGGWQDWATQTCTLSASATGYHNIYLVFTGSASPNLEWLAFNF